jgi:archaellum biogenesis ATPase FlaH
VRLRSVNNLTPTSPQNLLYEIREQRRDALKLELASAFASDKDKTKEIEQLWEEWEKLIAGDIDGSDKSEVLIAPDLADIMEKRSTANRIKVYPDALNSVLDGGALRGHHIVLFAVTDMGKTLFTLNMVRGFIEQGYKVLYVGNEDPVSDLIERFLMSFTGKDKWTIRKHWRKAQDWANKRGWDRLVWAELSPGTLSEIRSLIEKHKPDVLVVDQIRNLDTGDKNFVRVLEVAAQGMRNFAKKYDLLSISVTQAGDSANGKKILSRGDIDNSNVGIPGTADLMLGIGADEDDEYNGVRTLSFPKNKISGNKQPVQVIFNTKNMRVE